MTRSTKSSVTVAREIVKAFNIESTLEAALCGPDQKLLMNLIAAALQDETEACAKVADQWEDSTQDIDCGVTMVSVLKSGRPDTDGGIVIQEVDKLEPWEQRQAEMLGEYREVARREERRIVATAIRRKEQP